MLRESEITRFHEYVKSLGLRFPVAALTKATGFAKGQVSDYLSKKKEPSEKFINAVYEKFPISSINVPHGTPPPSLSGDTSLQGLIASNDKLAQANLTLADAHKIIAKNNEVLIHQLKSTEATFADNPIIHLSLSRLLEVLAELGEGKLWETKQDGLIQLGNVLSEKESLEESKVDIRGGASIKSTAKAKQ